MSNISKATRVSNKASIRILASLERAKGRLADIPLGEQRLDPRTEKKRAEEIPSNVDTTLTRLLYEMRGKYNDAGGQE